jgi:hypothetical protein
MRTHRLLPRALPVALLAATALSACGGSDDGGAAKATTTTTGAGSVSFVAGPVTVQRTAATGEADPAEVQALLAATSAYVEAASLAPMAGRTGSLRTIATPGAIARATGTDADALGDASLGKVRDVRVTAKPAPVTILTDANGAATLGAVTIDVTITGATAGGPITVHRTGELAFTKGTSGWSLDSWRLSVTLDGKGVPAAPRTSSTTKAP